jgi:hypothetical protein
MKDALTLQDEYTDLVNRCEATRAELDQVKDDLITLIGDLVESDSKNRPALVLKRTELVNQRATLTDELTELERRRDIAYLAPLELAVSEAQAELDKRQETAKASKAAMDAAVNDMLRFNNGPSKGSFSEAKDKQRIEIETRKAHAMAQSSVDGQYYFRAQNQLRRAQADLEDAKKSLKI